MDSFSELVQEEEETTEGPQLVLPSVGEVIDDKYVITKLIGEGGMGAVYEAIHTRLGHPVALKFLHPAAAVVPGATARFEREARACAQLRGPHVAHVLDVDVTDGALYMVMELLRGRDLEAELRERGSLPIAEAVDVVLQVCSAMSEAHALGIVHRDLKPSNIFLALNPEAPGERTVKVLDFGISLIAKPDAARVTATSVSLGTPLYMSPEQVRCSKRVDARTDIWSIGVILYELLAGEPPFLGEATAAVAAIVADETPSVREKRREVPVGLDVVIARSLSKPLERRYQSVDALADALAPFGSGRYRSSKPSIDWSSSASIAFTTATRRTESALRRLEPRRPRLMMALGACLVVLPAITFAHGFGRGPTNGKTVDGDTCSEPPAVALVPVATAAPDPTKVEAPALTLETVAVTGARDAGSRARARPVQPDRESEAVLETAAPSKPPTQPKPQNPLYL